jgi:hypothetical protein
MINLTITYKVEINELSNMTTISNYTKMSKNHIDCTQIQTRKIF